MLVVRASKRLATSLRRAPTLAAVESSGRLGDWYADEIHLPPRRLVVFVNAATFLVVVVRRAPYDELMQTFVERLDGCLGRLSIAPETRKSEIAHASPIVLSKANERRVIGKMNDIRGMLFAMADGDRSSLLDDLAGLESFFATEFPNLTLPGHYADRAVEALLRPTAH